MAQRNKVEFADGQMDAADAVRDEFEEWLCPDDDARTLTVTFQSDTPEDVLDEAWRQADMSYQDSSEAAGQVELTDNEKDQIDFSEVSIFTARTAKAVYLDEGVTDWLSYWSEDLTTTGDMRESANRAKRDSQGKRLDADEPGPEQKAAGAAAQAESEACNHARGHCEHGEPDACEFLKESCGYDDEEVADLLGDRRDEQADETEQTELVTVGGDEYDEMEVSPQVAGALRRSWQGYKSSLSAISDALDTVRESVTNAERAMLAINRIRENHGQEQIEANRLHDLLDSLDQMPRQHRQSGLHEHATDTPTLSKAPRGEPQARRIDAEEMGTPTLSKAPQDRPAARQVDIEQWSVDQLAEGYWSPALIRDAFDINQRAATSIHEAGNNAGSLIRYVNQGEGLDWIRNVGPDTAEKVRKKLPVLESLGVDHTWHMHVPLWADAADSDPTPTISKTPEREPAARTIDAEQVEDTPDQFAQDKQGTLSTGVDAEQVAEEKQVTLTGADEGDDHALPSAWRRKGSTWVAGPWKVQMDSHDGEKWNIKVFGPDGSEEIASGIRSAVDAEEIAERFTNRVAPDEMTLHSGDSTVPQAAAEAKRNVYARPDDGGLSQFSGDR